MLTLDPHKTFYIMVKARAFDAKVEPVEPDPGSNPSDDRDVEILEDYDDDPTLEELTGAIEALNEDELAELVAVVRIGTGDGDGDDWAGTLAEARDALDANTVRWLVATPQLGDLIEEGLAALNAYSNDDALGRL
jgi:hypothetical protein